MVSLIRLSTEKITTKRPWKILHIARKLIWHFRIWCKFSVMYITCLSLSWKTEQRRRISFFVSDGICLQSCCVYMETWWSRWASELQKMFSMLNYPANGWKRFQITVLTKITFKYEVLSLNNNIRVERLGLFLLLLCCLGHRSCKCWFSTGDKTRKKDINI